MTIQIALDKTTNDIINTSSGIERVDKGRYTVQLVQNRLATFLGEWALDSSVGWVNLDDFEKNPDLFDIEVRARSIILSTPDVLSINSMDLYMSNRQLTLTFTATTTYGEIDLTIPWGT